MDKKDFDNLTKWSPELKAEGNFTQISNHLILNPNLTAEEKELILVFLINKNGYRLTIKGICDDLQIKPRQVLVRLNSLVNKGVLVVSGKSLRLVIPKIDNPKHRLTGATVAPNDIKSCVTTQFTPEKVAFDDTKTCVVPQVKPELSLDYQGISDVDNTTNIVSDERTFKWGARSSENKEEYSVNANKQNSLSVGRTPLYGAPPERLLEKIGNSADNANTELGRSSPEGHNPTVSNSVENSVRNPNDCFFNIESCLNPEEIDRRSPFGAAPVISEFWTDDNTTNLNYRRFKMEFDKNPDFKYSFTQFEEILALALFFFLDKRKIDIPSSNGALQKNARLIGLQGQDTNHIDNDDIGLAYCLFDNQEQGSRFLKNDLFSKWKIKSPTRKGVPPPTKPDTRHSHLNQVPARQ